VAFGLTPVIGGTTAQQLNRFQDAPGVVVHMRAERKQSESQNGVNGDCRQQQQHMRPVGEVREQQKAREERGFDDGGPDERGSVMPLTLLDAVERCSTNFINANV